MMAKKKKITLTSKRMRDIAWDVGRMFPLSISNDFINLYMISPGQGCVQWHVRVRSVNSLKKKFKGNLDNAAFVIRIYDVTDIIFDGTNAHTFFDIDTGSFSGTYYFVNEHRGRNLMAEAGLRAGDGGFHPLCRSIAVFFERDRPAANFSTEGLFVGGMLNRTFSVENIFDAPVFEQMNMELARCKKGRKLTVAAVHMNIGAISANEDRIGNLIMLNAEKASKFGAKIIVFKQDVADKPGQKEESLISSVEIASKSLIRKVSMSHIRSRFHVIHCHDWYSSKAGIGISRKLKLPLVLTLHSTEYERTQGREMDKLSVEISAWEKNAVENSDLIIVPHSYTRQQVINLYGAPDERVVVIPDVMEIKFHDARTDVLDGRRMFGIPPEVPVVLFAGEMSHASGADLLLDALPTVCRNHKKAHFIFAGDGPLRGELEARAHSSGIGHRCHFLGHVVHRTFESVLISSDFVVIPARTWQDEGLARMAIEYGRPVLTTHQSGIKCVEHGKTGLVTFDNPGSIVWGIQELLFNPLRDHMVRLAVRKKASETPSIESIAAQHYMYYAIIFNEFKGRKNA